RGYYRTALETALKAIDADPKAASAMAVSGEIYLEGYAVPQDSGQAAKWFALAANAGDARAAFALARLKLKGLGGTKDPDGARKLLRQAAAGGVPEAEYTLGDLALVPASDTVGPDYARATRHYEAAAKLGDPVAWYALGLLSEKGLGVKRDQVAAAELMRAAARGGVLEAMVDYARMLLETPPGGDADVEAAHWLERAANAGEPLGQDRLARLYLVGRGVKKDMPRALKWRALAKAAGIDDADLDARLKDASPADREAADVLVRAFQGVFAPSALR
ncbi:MAG: sel1 repeat family protein, partial [Hyphomicrobiales bacterium]|nr:sel1 repeat family protein [Hyphomicrobiales bacterium]